MAAEKKPLVIYFFLKHERVYVLPPSPRFTTYMQWHAAYCFPEPILADYSLQAQT